MRFFFGLPFAAIVTACLFLVMGAAVRSETVQIDSYERTVDLTVTSRIDTDGKVAPAQPSPRSPIAVPKPIPPLSEPIHCDCVGPVSRMPGQPPAILVETTPTYPTSCEGVGTVTVRFDITPDGSVTNAKVVQTTDSCFDQAAIGAITRWKYLPDSNDMFTRSDIQETITLFSETTLSGSYIAVLTE